MVPRNRTRSRSRLRLRRRNNNKLLSHIVWEKAAQPYSHNDGYHNNRTTSERKWRSLFRSDGPRTLRRLRNSECV